VTSFPVTWQPPPTSYSPVRSQTYPKLDLQAFYRYFQVTSGQTTSLLVTWGHVTSFPVTWQPPPTSYSPVRSQTYPKLDLQAFYGTSRWLPLKWRHVRVTSGHVKSSDVISSHVTATSCELQPCRSSNAPKAWLIGLLQPLPGDFQSNHVTCGSLPVTRDYVTSFPVTWQPPPASYCPVKAQTYPKLTYRPSIAFPGDLRSNVTSRHLKSRDVITSHLTATSCKLQDCSSSNVPKTWRTGLLKPLPGDFRSNDVTSGSLPVTSGHLTSFPVTWLPPRAYYSPVVA